VTITVYHVGMVVSDLDRSIRFYTEGLGLECEEVFEADGEMLSNVVGVPDARMRVASLVADDGVLFVIVQYLNPPTTVRPFEDQAERTSTGSAHVAFMVPSIQKTYKKLVKMGATAVNPPIETRPGHLNCYMQDPDGNWIELVQDATHAATPFRIRQGRVRPNQKA